MTYDWDETIEPIRDIARGLSVGEKVMRMRMMRRLTHEMVSRIIKIKSKINLESEALAAAEQGDCEFTKEQLKAIKSFFKIEGLPLTDDERVAFVRRIYLWRDYMKAGRIDEAKAMRKELKQVELLGPCDFDLVYLFKMFDLRLLAVTGKYDEADSWIELYILRHVKDFNDENLYHYYYNKGFLCSCRGDYEESVEFFLKALDIYEGNESILPGADSGLYYNISWCYTYLEFPNQAVFFLQKAKEVYADGRISPFPLGVDCDLAVNYIHLNQIRYVERMLGKCLVEARSINDDSRIAHVLYVFGLLNKKIERWETAIDYYEQALEYCQEGSVFSFPILYHKIHCLIESNMLATATKALKQVNESCEDEMWKVYFGALGRFLDIKHKMTRRRPESEHYILSVAIPRFRKENDYFFALDYYRLLESYYEKTNREIESSQMTKEILAIFTRCYVNQKGGVEL